MFEFSHFTWRESCESLWASFNINFVRSWGNSEPWTQIMFLSVFTCMLFNTHQLSQWLVSEFHWCQTIMQAGIKTKYNFSKVFSILTQQLPVEPREKQAGLIHQVLSFPQTHSENFNLKNVFLEKLHIVVCFSYFIFSGSITAIYPAEYMPIFRAVPTNSFPTYFSATYSL